MYVYMYGDALEITEEMILPTFSDRSKTLIYMLHTFK